MKIQVSAPPPNKPNSGIVDNDFAVAVVETLDSSSGGTDLEVAADETTRIQTQSSLTSTDLDGNCRLSGETGCDSHKLENGLNIKRTRTTEKTVSEFLHIARKQGKSRLRRLRGPTLLLGSACLSVGIFYMATGATLAVVILSFFLRYIGLVSLFLSLVPTDVRSIPLTTGIMGIPVALMIGLQHATSCSEYIKMLKESSCQFLEDLGHDIPCSAVAIASGVRFCSAIAMFCTCCYIVSCLYKRLSAPVLLHRVWRLLALIFFLFGIFALGSSVARFCAGEISSGMLFLLKAAVHVPLFAVTARYHYIVKLQSWLMSRGEAATVAAGVAELLGAEQPEWVLDRARQSFLCVQASQFTYNDMLLNKPDPSLRNKASRANLGHVDAFLSHSWHDDPALKWATLQSWCEEFKGRHRGREPTLWIDKFCIDQQKIEESLACLPIYLSGCKSLLILCGTTYLSRLWCVLEIFIFLEMGGQLENLEVRFLENKAETRKDSSESVLKSKCTHGSSSRSMSSGWSKSISRGWSRWSQSISKETQTLGDILDSFDSRNAQCFSETDTLRLQRVLEFSGATKVNRLVKRVFVEAYKEKAEARSA